METKNGLFEENGKRIFYKDGHPYHAGVVEQDGRIYYIGKGGEAVTGEHIVHREMGNGILPRGTYTFDEDGVLIEGSFREPREHTHKRRHKNRRAHKGRKRLKKADRKRLIGLAAAVAVLAAAVTAVAIWDGVSPRPTESSPSLGATEYLEEEVAVPLCSDAAHALYNGEMTVAQAVAHGDPYRAYVFEGALGAQLLLSEHEDLSDARVFSLEASSSVTLDNLKTDTTYYYSLRTAETCDNGSFRTAAGYRFLSVPGVYNMRDIGGYKTADGHTIRQGMIVRGTELDGLVRAEYCPGQQAIAAMVEQFGFVYDFDLRQPDVGGKAFHSRLGVEHTFYGAPMYGNIFNTAFKNSLRSMFKDLADSRRYPMYMHCTHGVDRTGTLVYLLMGVLGVSEEQMMREYRLSAFFVKEYADDTSIEGLYDGLQVYEGDTINEKIETFLIEEIGVTQEELTCIREILLEE